MADRCGFCAGAGGPLTRVEGLFTVQMCLACLARRSHGRGPYPDLSDAEMRAGLDLLPTWVLQQEGGCLLCTNHRLVAEMGERLARSEPVARMYQAVGLAWLERQARSPRRSSSPVRPNRLAGPSGRRGSRSETQAMPVDLAIVAQIGRVADRCAKGDQRADLEKPAARRRKKPSTSHSLTEPVRCRPPHAVWRGLGPAGVRVVVRWGGR